MSMPHSSISHELYGHPTSSPATHPSNDIRSTESFHSPSTPSIQPNHPVSTTPVSQGVSAPYPYPPHDYNHHQQQQCYQPEPQLHYTNHHHYSHHRPTDDPHQWQSGHAQHHYNQSHGQEQETNQYQYCIEPPIRRMSAQPIHLPQPQPTRSMTYPPNYPYSSVPAPSISNNHNSSNQQTHERYGKERFNSGPSQDNNNNDWNTQTTHQADIEITRKRPRPRELSINTANEARQMGLPSSRSQSGHETAETPLKTTFWNSNMVTSSNSKSKNSKSSGVPVTTQNNSDKSAPLTAARTIPAVLTREKKQRACTNCRKAKLKCIVEEDSSECVRCLSRKERCIFHPRAQDDEAHQKLARDLYQATTHLSQLSKAVHHILYHLTDKNIIPPFVNEVHPDGLDHYELPGSHDIVNDDASNQNDLDAKHSESKSGMTRQKRRRINKRNPVNDDNNANLREDIVEEEKNSHKNKSPLPQEMTPNASISTPCSSIPSALRPSSAMRDQTVEALPPPQSFKSVIARPLSTIVSSSPPPHSARLPPPLIPPNRPSSSTPSSRASPAEVYQSYQPSIGQVLASSNEGWNMGQSSHPDPINGSDRALPRNRLSSPLIMESAYTPGSYTTGVTRYETHNNLRPESLGSLGQSQIVNPAIISNSPMYNNTQIPNPISREHVEEEDVEVVIGSEDPRKDIVKKGLIEPKDALSLVKYFHKSLSPLLYGYPLSFYKFPYISGPKYITPLLLSVLCLISSERRNCFSIRYHTILAEEVTNLLETSPAESWQRFEIGIGYNTTDFGDPDGDEPLDAEFGLGPEEIVAACILATYMTEREQASVIARSAFRWARGWIKLLKSSASPRFTIAESVGLVPPERQATDLDMARIWLLCYIVDSTERLQLSLDAPPPRDASFWCSILIPTIQQDQNQLDNQSHVGYDIKDILLTYHARLITIMNDWRLQYNVSVSASQSPSDLVKDIKQLVVKDIKQLALQTNDRLLRWNVDFERLLQMSVFDKNESMNGGIGESTKQHIMITYHFIRMSIHSTLSKYLPSSIQASPLTVNSTSSNSVDHYGNKNTNTFQEKQKEEYNLRINSKKIIFESAISFMEICRNWPIIDSRQNGIVAEKSLFNLSPTYLFFVTLMGSELVESVKEFKDSKILNIKADNVIPLLRSVGEMLFLGELDEQHVSRTTAKTLFLYCERLQHLR
ncbi:uncharacterized protein L201_001307 [Kwoniella dendrophila CBS 6074]|uniref:Zn(2)-C6 fungal-type domain-containing protein n=1 Tax=Kwoniella dendrophila CBS 6074 TaxID=1295534 RepID=A0AAX4JPE9_9TREE